MTSRQALQMARQQDLDLVEVAPNSDPPVCRLLDYGKLRYLTSKKERESKKTQKSTELREMRFRPNISEQDLETKLRKVKELVEDGAKVKITVRFRGREATHQQLGLQVLKRVADELKNEVRLEKPPAMEGRSLSMVLIPTAQGPAPAAQPSAAHTDQGENKPETRKTEELADAKT
jgi:translation initiation factor IF-3